MEPKLREKILERLDRDFKFKEKKDWLQQGECPNCHKKELYTSKEHPWVLRCNRINHCGHEEHVKDLYSDLFESWSDRHPPAPENPNASADAYMRDARGFEIATLKGWYTQESFFDREKNIGTATVRFQLGQGVWWERFIDKAYRFGKQKANFRGSYGGMWWCPPSVNLANPDIRRIWIVEGIFDAIALVHKGEAAVAAMSTNNYPGDALEALAKAIELNGGRRPELIWGFDGDKAGRSFTRKYVTRCREEGWTATAAQIPTYRGKKRDWNDLLQADRLDEQHIEEYLYHGALLIAQTAQVKANLIYSRTGAVQFSFTFEQKLYWFKLDLDAFDKSIKAIEEKHPDLGRDELREMALKEANCVRSICNCQPEPLYYLKNEVTDEAWYYFRVDFPHDGPSVKGTFSAGQLCAPAEFKKRLLHLGAGAIWEGTSGQLDRLLSQWTTGIKTVKTVDFIGYSADHKAYIFTDVAIAGEKVIEQNDEDYFDIGKLAIKSLSKSVKLAINPDLKAHRTDWLDKLYTCYGPRGIVVLAYWLGSLYAEQIRDRFESFPFIEIVGEPGSGKTTLIETLWKLLGREGYEGFDPQKGSMVGFLRSMAQVSNLPVVLIESDRSDDGDNAQGRPKQAFHWDSLKSLYNGGNLRTTGVKSGGLDTYEPQFRAALVIAQNAPVSASAAIMERLVHVYFDKSRQSDAGREAGIALARTTAAEMSGFLVKATTKAPVLQQLEAMQREYEKRLATAGVQNLRVQKNHAQLMCCVDALKAAAPVTTAQVDEAKDMLVQLALAREKALAREHPLVEQFWESFDYLDGTNEDGTGEAMLNHSRTADVIAVNLNHYVQLAAERRQQIPSMTDLKRVLKTSRERRFIDVKTVNSAIHERFNEQRSRHEGVKPKTLKCWVFQDPRHRAARP